jgi:probable addiction module antidote protein
MEIVLKNWDPAEDLDSEEAMADYLEAAFEDGDPGVIAAVIGDIARAKSMTQIAKDTGLSRESLYRALSADGNPSFSTILKVIDALGLKLRPESINATPKKATVKPRAKAKTKKTAKPNAI